MRTWFFVFAVIAFFAAGSAKASDLGCRIDFLLLGSKQASSWSDRFGLSKEVWDRVDKPALDQVSDAWIRLMLGAENADMRLSRGLPEAAVQRAVNYKLDRIFKNSTQLAAVIRGNSLPRIYISTHQSPALQEDTLKLANDSSAASSPLIQLYSKFTFTNQHGANLNGRSVIRYSHSGELADFKLNTNEVHVMGGCFGACLTRTISDAAKQTLDVPSRRHVDIVIHGRLSYSRSFDHSLTDELSDLPDSRSAFNAIVTTARKLFGAIDPAQDKIERIANGLAQLHRRNGVRLTDPEFEYLRGKATRSSPGTTEIALTFRRRTDGKTVTIRMLLP